MQIHNNTLIAECSAYDFKEMLERKQDLTQDRKYNSFRYIAVR